MLLPSLYLYSIFVQILCLFLYRSQVSPEPVICGRFVLGRDQGHIQGIWHLHDPEFSVSICVVFGSSWLKEMAVGSPKHVPHI